MTASERKRFEANLAEILAKAGLDLDTPGTVETPRRFLQALFDATEGYDGDPKLLTAFPTECHGGASCEIAQIVEGPIPFFALCEHHAMPFFGRAYVAYVAHEEIIGISKLTRLVRVLTRRFGVQERMTHQIADELMRLMNAHGVAVYMEAHHLCTQMRGVREDSAMTRTTAYRGTYESNPALRSEFFELSGMRRSDR
jgi:GTP cyclohydrolase IA